ncbi:MAG TPA: bifunctional serine/threonine-protein kinase/formylglycine-generating enzyme family protein [Chlamydiales bacterium]|nr:bifunctional serine/threonine-protein kinase/formylglycine-generating enzyme family protein [Chlamydiales bacterium]
MDLLGDYTILKELGSGAFGTVYLAEHRFIKKIFALKVIPEIVSQDSSFVRRFETQIAKIANLDHPNIVKIHNVSCADGKYFVVMDPIVDSHFETMTIEKYLSKPLSEEVKEKILRDIASALDFAHDKGVFHGALKLSNILVNGDQIVLSDFGITRLIGEGTCFLKICNEIAKAFLPQAQFSSERLIQQSRNFVRSFTFLAPEQKWLDGTIVDEKADTYAFGVLSYFIFTGKMPEGHYEQIPNTKQNWDLFIERCLHPSPHARPQKMIFAMNETLSVSRSTELSHLSEIEEVVENTQQMAFEFQPLTPEKISNLKPVILPREIARPEYETDPGAIFHRDLLVSPYTPTITEVKEIEPILTPMVVVAGGKYMRGSTEGARDELPRHAIQLSSFALDIHPVTNEQFVRFLEVMGGEKDQNNNDIIRLKDARIKRHGNKLTIEAGYAKHPVIGVTWYGASAYAKWVGKRLPTEAEWEAAAGGGKEIALFPTGSDIDRTQANYFSTDTTAVKSYAANAFELYDMAGNVYEWCQDWYAYNYYDLSALEPENPKGPQQGVYRCLRGGCWKSLREDLRCSHRHRNNPGAVNSTYGFRCAADVTS